MSPAPKKPKVTPLTPAERDERIAAAGRGEAITPLAKRAKAWRLKKEKEAEEAKKPENSSTDYSKLHLLGRVLVERRKRTSDDQPGQGKLAFDPGTHQKGSRRKQRATPRRREGDQPGKRGIDKATDTRGADFDVDKQGTRAVDVTRREIKKHGKEQKKERAATTNVFKMPIERAATVYAIADKVKSNVKAGIRPVKFKKSNRKQNKHTATSPID